MKQQDRHWRKPITVQWKLWKLRSRKPKRRSQAAAVLGTSGDTRAIRPLIDSLRDWSPRVRSAAATALGQLGYSEAAPPLLDALSDSESSVRSAAHAALERLQVPSDQIVKGYAAALNNRDTLVRIAAVEALSRLGGEEAITALLNALASSGSGAVSSSLISALEALEALKVVSREQLLQAYVGALNISKLPSVAEAMGRLGDRRAIKPLLDSLSYYDWSIRSAAIKALEKLQAPKNDIIEGCLGALNHGSHETTLVTIQALRLWGVSEEKLRVAVRKRIEQQEQSLEHLKHELSNTTRVIGTEDYSSWDHSYVGSGGGANWIEDIREIKNPDYERLEGSIRLLKHEIKQLRSQLNVSPQLELYRGTLEDRT